MLLGGVQEYQNYRVNLHEDEDQVEKHKNAMVSNLGI